MAFQFIPALKALAPIVASATGLGSWLANRSQDKSRGMEQRIGELETAVQEQAKMLGRLAEQVQVLAGQLQEKEEQILRLRRGAAVSWMALILALAAAGLAVYAG